MMAELGVTLAYPSYREGLAAIVAAEHASAWLPTSRVAAIDASRHRAIRPATGACRSAVSL